MHKQFEEVGGFQKKHRSDSPKRRFTQAELAQYKHKHKGREKARSHQPKP